MLWFSKRLQILWWLAIDGREVYKGRLAFHHAAGGNLIHCTMGHAMETDILEVGKRTELLHAHF